MTAPPPPPPPVYEPVNYHVHDNLQDEGTESSAYSAEFSSEGILDDRNEEKRITEAEKNERVQRQLQVSFARGPLTAFDLFKESVCPKSEIITMFWIIWTHQN